MLEGAAREITVFDGRPTVLVAATASWVVVDAMLGRNDEPTVEAMKRDDEGIVDEEESEREMEE